MLTGPFIEINDRCPAIVIELQFELSISRDLLIRSSSFCKVRCPSFYLLLKANNRRGDIVRRMSAQSSAQRSLLVVFSLQDAHVIRVKNIERHEIQSNP